MVDSVDEQTRIPAARDTVITLIRRINHLNLLLSPLYAERPLFMGSTRVAWVSELAVH